MPPEPESDEFGEGENRLQMHHIMHYSNNHTGKDHTIVVFTSYPGTDITQEVSKDGRQVLFHIRTPQRLLAKEFVNPDKHKEDGYDIFEDDQAQCMMAYCKTYTPQSYTYEVDLPQRVLSHSDFIELCWWVVSNGARALVCDFIQQTDDDYRVEIQTSSVPRNLWQNVSKVIS